MSDHDDDDDGNTLVQMSSVLKLLGGDLYLIRRHEAIYFIRSTALFGAPALCQILCWV